MQPLQNTSRPRHSVIAGMPRAGTTYLYHAFATHPDAFVAYRKELRFFSVNYHRGAAWYSRFFSKAAANLICVDASPDYFMDSAASARIRNFSPEIKVVLAVRDPATWAVSLHRQLGTIESRVPKFSDFLDKGEYPDFSFSWLRRQPKIRFSLKNGFVQSQLTAFRDALGDRLLLYDFDWFERNPLAVLQGLEVFLGTKAYFSKGNLPGGRINARERKYSRWLSYISSRDVMINMAGSFLPRKWLIALRMKIDRGSISQRRLLPVARDVDDLILAQNSLAADIAYVKSLFSESPMVLGNGCPYRRSDHIKA